MPTTLTPPALKELEELLWHSRRQLSETYREWKVGLAEEAMAEKRAHHDLIKVKNQLQALRILFGREPLPKHGGGRQQALYEAQHWLSSPTPLSEELERHLRNLLLRGERTNIRKGDNYVPLKAPEERKTFDPATAPRPSTDDAGVYVVSRQAFMLLGEATGKPPLVKIGWSHNVWDRISSAQTWEPDPLQVLRIFRCSDPQSFETKLHICLDTLGLAHGGGGGREWFYADLSLIDALASSLGLEDSAETDSLTSPPGRKRA